MNLYQAITLVCIIIGFPCAAIIINIDAIKNKRALKLLLKRYKPYQNSGSTINDLTQLGCQRHVCPLCKAHHSNCKKCSWMKKTGRSCISNEYNRMIVKDRIIQIKQWLSEM